MTQKSAAAHEALGEKVPFTFEGVDYLVTPTSEWEFEALEAFEEGKVLAFLRSILGEEDYGRLKASKPKVAKLRQFSSEVVKALGVSGN